MMRGPSAISEIKEKRKKESYVITYQVQLFYLYSHMLFICPTTSNMNNTTQLVVVLFHISSEGLYHASE